MEIMVKELPWYKHPKVKEELKLDKPLVFQVNSNNSMQFLNQRLRLTMLEIDFDTSPDNYIKSISKIHFW